MYIHFSVKDARVIYTCGSRHENAYRSVCIHEAVSGVFTNFHLETFSWPLSPAVFY
jgi:hypothetical protein